ncbi:hypothetical protein HCN44_009695 [Aphidius gifuensis]|uniref:Uncharacterized protein n=2 Tax=Aphidius gifuensis TaxID=684658 RepID=A0A835CWA3_APHGI|nr:hypothetical protein HCN44_009695 [Aphidius gifuensis]
MLVGATLNFSDINSYAKVSRSGSGLSNNFKPSVENSNNEGRNFQVSPVYVSSKISKLKNGEAFDYPSTQRYSTLDEELLANYDDVNMKNQAQDRFHPPPKFEHSIAHSNAVRQQNNNNENSSSPPGSSPSASSSSSNYQTLPKQVFSSDFNYPSTSKPIMDNLPSITIDNYSPDNSYSEQPVSYVSGKMPYQGPDNLPSYLEKFPSKPQFPSYIDTTFPLDNEHLSFHHDHQDDDEHNHELIYDHPPDHYDHYDHHHHHHHMTMTTTTEEPEEMNDQRLSKRPYSYYYLGKKLWYLPLYFSIYFIIYIGALVLKSIARHKINFPSTLANVGDTRSINNIPDWWDLTKIVLDAIDDITTRLHD